MNDMYTTLMLTGWAFQISAWIPKPFITNIQNRRSLNLALSAIALTIFLSAGVTIAYTNFYL